MLPFKYSGDQRKQTPESLQQVDVVRHFFALMTGTEALEQNKTKLPGSTVSLKRTCLFYKKSFLNLGFIPHKDIANKSSGLALKGTAERLERRECSRCWSSWGNEAVEFLFLKALHWNVVLGSSALDSTAVLTFHDCGERRHKW